MFSELTRIAARDPVMLRPLLPFCALARRAHDPIRRQGRVESVVSILGDAHSATPAWIVTDVFLARFTSAWRKLVSQHDRLVYVLDGSRERAGWVDDILDIVAKLAEGPYRLYGGMVLVAGRVAAGGESVLDAEVSSRYRRLTFVLRGLRDLNSDLAAGVDDLLRHAEAHYDYAIEAGLIKVHHLPPASGAVPRVDELLVDDVIAAVLNLLELSLAMAIGVLMWVWEHGSIETREGIRQTWLTA